MKARRSGLLVLGLGVLASQAGHMLAYQARFGAAAQPLQSSGGHAYFPTLAKTGLGLIAALTLFALLVIGLARVAGRRAPRRASAAPSYLRLFAALFTIQLAVFAVQETAEAAVAGARPSPVTVLLLWGTLGQMPVAAMAALALRWLLTRFESAVTEIRGFLSLVESARAPLAQLVAVMVATEDAPSHSRVTGSALLERGPPSRLRFASK